MLPIGKIIEASNFRVAAGRSDRDNILGHQSSFKPDLDLFAVLESFKLLCPSIISTLKIYELAADLRRILIQIKLYKGRQTAGYQRPLVKRLYSQNGPVEVGPKLRHACELPRAVRQARLRYHQRNLMVVPDAITTDINVARLLPRQHSHAGIDADGSDLDRPLLRVRDLLLDTQVPTIEL